MALNEDKITRYARQIMGATDNDCPGCLHEWVRQLTLREAELGSTILGWKFDSSNNIVHIIYGNTRTGEISMFDELHDPEDMSC